MSEIYEYFGYDSKTNTKASEYFLFFFSMVPWVVSGHLSTILELNHSSFRNNHNKQTQIGHFLCPISINC